MNCSDTTLFSQNFRDSRQKCYRLAVVSQRNQYIIVALPTNSPLPLALALPPHTHRVEHGPFPIYFICLPTIHARAQLANQTTPDSAIQPPIELSQITTSWKCSIEAESYLDICFWLDWRAGIIHWSANCIKLQQKQSQLSLRLTTWYLATVQNNEVGWHWQRWLGRWIPNSRNIRRGDSFHQC